MPWQTMAKFGKVWQSCVFNVNTEQSDSRFRNDVLEIDGYSAVAEVFFHLGNCVAFEMSN